MKRILIIEDEKDLREALHITLRNAGYEVSSVPTSAEGLEAVKAQVPDLILLDIMTHSLHGIAFLQELRALPGAQGGSKVIVLTNLDNEITREQIADYAIDDYLVKVRHSLAEVREKVRDVLDR